MARYALTKQAQSLTSVEDGSKMEKQMLISIVPGLAYVMKKQENTRIEFGKRSKMC